MSKSQNLFFTENNLNIIYLDIVYYYMKTNILIKDLIFFGACAEAYHMDSCKLSWAWKYACGCEGNLDKPTHFYDDCAHQDNLFWSERFKSEGRTIKMGMQQDEIEEVVCSVVVSDEDADKLRAITNDAADLLGDEGLEYYDLFIAKIDAEKDCDRLSVLEEHHFYTKTKDWYITNNITPMCFEEIKYNVLCKYIAHRMLHQLVHNREAVIKATWTPTIGQEEPLLFEEHVVKLTEGGHVTPQVAAIKGDVE